MELNPLFFKDFLQINEKLTTLRKNELGLQISTE